MPFIVGMLCCVSCCRLASCLCVAVFVYAECSVHVAVSAAWFDELEKVRKRNKEVIKILVFTIHQVLLAVYPSFILQDSFCVVRMRMRPCVRACVRQCVCASMRAHHQHVAT